MRGSVAIETLIFQGLRALTELAPADEQRLPRLHRADPSASLDEQPGMNREYNKKNITTIRNKKQTWFAALVRKSSARAKLGVF